MRIFMPKLKIVGVVLLILGLANYLFTTQSQMLEENSYEHVNPSMLTAVQQTNKRILKKKAIDSLLSLPPKQWELRSVSAISDVHVGATVFIDSIPVSASPFATETKTVHFHISKENAQAISKISEINLGTETSYTCPQFIYDCSEKLENGFNANYIYAIGLSRFQIYEYNYAVRDLFGNEIYNDMERVAVPAGDSVYLLKVAEEAIKVNIENATNDKVLTWDSQSDYVEELTDRETTADLRADRCVFFY